MCIGCCVVVLGMIENSQVMEALYAFYVARAFHLVQYNVHVCGLVDASMFVVRCLTGTNKLSYAPSYSATYMYRSKPG